ncbi:tRNA 4-thiouridine(8) synthase ThiI [Blochmannia endosymbiont of Colobopsis nipponica]|uniref:tRNA uracil 4-sulfurtransferase ThiI n=1 Tax=Blochmannia endosymbiont of Colobopsis nipponica TaxID=2681987 RepID=UPI001780CC5C|nr:tRNA uracil 4-sulfurtransferase ThiI [Blochmannia endosymbiont of Colobopsis nipponica]QOI11187.1 tRNA 4-thiouridine(8) synthase ThiI [Blochmannia endosymbiont of Colobopsis nipponica]
MKLILKLSPEITIKSRFVRLSFSRSLVQNIRIVLKQHNYLVFLTRYWDYIELQIKDNNFFLGVVNLLINIPGISRIWLVEEYLFASIHDIGLKTISVNYNKLVGKAFCVRVKRHGEHIFTSQDIECYIGAFIIKNIRGTRVNLKNPEITVFLEINKNRFFLIIERYQGIGGFPLGTQGNVLSLLSGGFDSAVSSYMLMRRGCKVNYCFFNFGDSLHVVAIKKIAYSLWTQFGSSHKVLFFVVNFLPLVNEIIQKIDIRNVMIVLKRMMLRISASIAVRHNMQALITGESVGQVSSQTLINLHLIDIASDVLVLRPLISYDKEQIISIARKIGVEKIVDSVPEYCGFFSNHPTIAGDRFKIELQEKKINYLVFDEIFTQIQVFNIKDILSYSKDDLLDIEITSKVGCEEIVLDIRREEEQENNPLDLVNIKIQKLPFYKLASQFGNLDANKFYLLYCDHGIMSRIQANYLYEQGFRNVKIYRPIRMIK